MRRSHEFVQDTLEGFKWLLKVCTAATILTLHLVAFSISPQQCALRMPHRI